MATAASPDSSGTQVCSRAPCSSSPSQRQQSAKGKEVAVEPPSAQPAEGRRESEHSSPAGDEPTRHDDVGNGNVSSSDHTETPHPAPNRSQPPSSADSAGQAPPPSQPPAAVRSAEFIPTTRDKTENGTLRKEKGSLESEQTGTQTFKGSAPRKDASKSVSDGAHTSSSEVEQADSARARRSKGLFSKLLRVLVPCVGPTRAHSIDIDEKDKVPSPTKTNDVTTELKEKQVAKEAEELPPAPQEPPGTTPNDAQASTSDVAIPPPLQPIDIPEQPNDPSVLVPPSPTKTLPLEETEGVTSGAVQPPGSTGEESVHNHSRRNSRDMGDETDGSTSFTDDEDLEDGTPVEEIEDEEERLIMQGGAGIPIGPVSCSLRHPHTASLSLRIPGWCSKTIATTIVAETCRPEVSGA